ncbi:MAG TPA: hypothetical protein VG963_12340, partial [Polyangiaceae bacterium]|nr:hypothetical protein [Polyangiaceae bacterium]
MKYAKNNFFAARPDERSADVLQPELTRWTLNVAGQRIHGTTRERPLAVFELVERAALKPLPRGVRTSWFGTKRRSTAIAMSCFAARCTQHLGAW